MKLWQGRFEEESDPVFEKMNRSLGIDAVLLEVDIRASRAHARALLGCGVLSQEEWKAIDQGLEQILTEYSPDQVKATPYEDIHTFVEATLHAKIGPAALASCIPAEAATTRWRRISGCSCARRSAWSWRTSRRSSWR